MGRNVVNATSGIIIPPYANLKALMVKTLEDGNRVEEELEEQLRRQLRMLNPQAQTMNFSDKRQCI